MKQAKMESIDMTKENIEKIGELLPNVITEIKGDDGKLKKGINFELLKQELMDDVVDGEECYDFTWVGKKAAIVEGNTPIRKTLRPCIEESKDWETTQNLYIEGDNLDVLKLLQESYLNSVKMIYIDPPYNTGRDFIYRDNFTIENDEYEELIGLYDEDDNRLFLNNQGNGRFHSNWCSMMYSRLKTAYNLLADDGVIFISIDDNEAHNLRKICDEIFGEENLVEVFYNQVRYANKSLTEKDFFQKLIEQTLVYKKQDFIPNRPFEEYSLDKFCYKIVEKTAGRDEEIGGKKVKIFMPDEYDIIQVEPNINGLKETWASGTVLKGNASGKYFDRCLSSRIDIDGLGVLYKVKGIGEDGLGYRYFTGPRREGATKGKFFSGVPTQRVNEISAGGSKKYKPIANFGDWSASFGNIRHEGGVDFRSGKKPVALLKRYIAMSTNPDNEDIVLDFFSGSASTAHAVMQLNAEDGGSRKFIMVQIQEKTQQDSDYQRAGYKNICEIGKERIRRAGDRINEEIINNNAQLKIGEGAKPTVDIGFRVLKVDSTNMKDVYYAANEYNQQMLAKLESNIKEDRTDLDLLYSVLLDWGLPLSLNHRIEKIENTTVHFYDCSVVDAQLSTDNCSLAACFEDKVSESVVREIAKRQPLRVVFRDRSFADSPGKINVEEIFKLLAPNTSVKVI